MVFVFSIAFVVIVLCFFVADTISSRIAFLGNVNEESGEVNFSTAW